MSDAHSLPAVGCARLENRGRMPEGLHLKNVSVSSSFVGPFGGCWRMPAGVHGPSGSNPVLDLPTKVDWEISRQLLSPVRKTCGECRGNYMTLWDPVRLRAAAPELRWSNGRTTMRRFSARLSPQAGVSVAFLVDGGPNANWATYLVTIASRSIKFGGPPNLRRPRRTAPVREAGFCWRMPAGVHGHAGPLLPFPASSNERAGELSSRCLSPAVMNCGECRRNYILIRRFPVRDRVVPLRVR